VTKHEIFEGLQWGFWKNRSILFKSVSY